MCKIVGIRLNVEGEVAAEQGVLLISNHVSWLDITVLSAVAPVSFVAKQEVASWPFVNWLAKLQRSVFVDRNRRNEVGDKANEILEPAGRRRPHRAVRRRHVERRQQRGAVQDRFVRRRQARGGAPMGAKVSAQTLALTYPKIYGLPLCRRGRHMIAWYGDMDMASHAWRLLGLGPIDAHIRIGPPVPLDDFPDRKALARYAEDKVRKDVVELLRGPPAACERGQKGATVARDSAPALRDYIARLSLMVSSTVAGAKLPFGSCRIRPAFTTLMSVVCTPRSALSASAK